VEVVRLPEVLKTLGLHQIDILKIDCEGAEVLVLEDLAATGWLRYTRWVRLEWHGRENLKCCQQLLEATHISLFETWQNHNGFALAHSRKDERPLTATAGTRGRRPT
jgi:hypothetical protein